MEGWRERFLQRFHELKRQNGLTQLQLAERIGFSQSAISAWMGGSRSPDRLEDYEALAEGLDVDPAWLIYGVDRTASGIQHDFALLTREQRAAVREHVNAYVANRSAERPVDSSDAHAE